MTVEELIDLIEEAEDRASEIWHGRKKFSVKHEARLRAKIRGIHLTEEQLFLQLWDAICEKSVRLDILSEGKNSIHNKFVRCWCDGIFHYVTDKHDELIYGTMCNCE